MLTIFTCPKPFTDPHIAIIQRNAITSWTLLRPRPEIILFGNEEGVAEICQELELRHVPEVARNEFGTPLLNDIFEKAQRLASYAMLSYVNADLILAGDFSRAVRAVEGWGKPVVMSGGRWGVDVRELLDFRRPGWEERLRSVVKERGRFSLLANDYFVFPRGFYKEMPPLAIGRGWFDGWILWKARSLNASVVDASPVVTAVHQDHDYSHAAASDSRALWDGEEARRNFKLAGVPRHWFLLEATHLLTANGLRRVWGRKLRFRCQEIIVYQLGPIRRALGLRLAAFRGLTRLASSVLPRDK